MPIFSSFLRFSIKIFLAIIFIFFLTMAIIWWKPQLILNEKNIKYALNYLPLDSLTWNNIEFGFSSRGFFTKIINIQAENLCLIYKNSVNTCINHLTTDLELKLKFPPSIKPINKLLIDARHVHRHSTVITEENNEEKILPDLRHSFFSMLKNLDSISILKINIQDLKLYSQNSTAIQGTVSLKKSNSLIKFHAYLWQKNTFKIDSNLSLILKNEALMGYGNIKSQFDKQKINTFASFTWEQKSIKVHLKNVSPINFLSNSLNAKIQSCFFDFSLNNQYGYPEKNKINCILQINTNKKFIPKTIINILGTLNLNAIDNKKIQANFNIYANTNQKTFQIDFLGKGDFTFSPNKKEKIVLHTPTMHMNFKTPEIMGFAKSFNNTKFAIPAPFQNLRGPISIHAELTNYNSPHSIKFKFNINTELKNKRQKLITKNFGKLELLHINTSVSPKIKLIILSELHEVELEAPPIYLENPPQIAPDTRFVTNSKMIKKKPDDSFQLQLTINTINPLLIHTNLLKAPIPIMMHLNFKKNAKTGKIEIQKMPINFFSKKAEIQYIRLDYKEKTELGNLNGLITYKNAEALVRISLLGSTKEPRIEFESDPPLNREQIIALILFNKPLHELTEEEAISSTNMSQAFLNGTFGIFSLFFLSSTPIQSINYDPITESYTVHLRVDKKTTVSLSSNFEQQKYFRIRRRLGGNWAIKTELQQEDQSENSILTLLEWFRRF